MFARIQRIIEDPSRIKRAIQRRMPGVMSVGKRAVSKKIRYRGLTLFKKSYTLTGDGAECFRREIIARRIFNDKPWIIPIKEQGEDWIVLPFLPEQARLDRAAKNMDERTRLDVARQALSILLDMHCAGYFHGDFHTQNLYWYKDQLIVGDFEKLTAYPEGARPPFPESFDLTGDARGITLPGNSAVPVYYGADPRSTKSLELVLDIPLEQALKQLKDDLKVELKTVCGTFRSKERRHRIRAQRIYSSFSLPYFAVSPDEAQRDPAKRLRRLGVNEEELKGASILDLGCNIGGSIFEAQRFGPARSLGVEFDGDKVAVATKIAAYNGLNTVTFVEANVDDATAQDLRGPHDVIFCFALVGHLQKPDRLYRLLGELTKKTLFFEGNRTTTQGEIEEKLQENGFRDIHFVGLCDDDCMADNNCRPLYVARK